jgi:glycosyltransferase involved in cell wall biosynthesis
MQKKILYWSPHINKEVATVKAVFNSAHSLSKYSNNFKPIIINAFGEWDDYSEKLKALNIGSIKIFNWKIRNPINGFWKSRLFYIFFSLVIFLPLIKIIYKEKPDYVIIHLITIPVLLASFFFKNTKFILRISGYPQLNIFRRSLWKILSKKLYSIFTPTLLTRELLIKKNIFSKNKIFLLRDPIVEISIIAKLKKQKINDLPNTTKYVISIGRLTKQKNFSFLIRSFSKIRKKLNNIKLLIIGSGEEELKLLRLIALLKLEDYVILMKYKKNIFNYLSNSALFVLTSEWEDPGFVLIEAAICNKLILSSNVENGPIEFIDNENCGVLFKKNNYEDFEKKFLYSLHASEDILTKKKISAKIKAKKYTIFSHYLQLAEYLKN